MTTRDHIGRTWRDIRDGIRFQPGRTALSFFAVVVGMVALTVLFSVLGGLKIKSRILVQELGANTFVVLPPSPEATDLQARLDESHARRLAANLPDCKVSSARWFEQAEASPAEAFSLVATDGNLAAVRQWKVRRGRFLDAADLAGRQRHAVISEAMSRRPGWDVGGVVTLLKEPFTIVGIVSAESSGLEAEGADRRVAVGRRAVFVPASTAQVWVNSHRESLTEVHAIFVGVPAAADSGAVAAAARRVLQDGSLSGERFSWVTPEVMLRGVRRLQAAIGFAAGSVAFLCILLGGITLMSLMVANVRDRVTEIGLRRALGATPRDIAVLFVAEACLVTGAASLLGTAAAHGLLWAFRDRFPSPLYLGAWTFLLPVALSLVVGAVFSHWPARLAAKISPTEALRNE